MTPPPPIHLRVGVVGSGAMGAEHLAALARLGVPAALYSPSGRGRELAGRFGAGFAGSLAELTDACAVVDICTPTDTHRAIAEIALAAGRDVICEKPLARTLKDAAAMVAAARAAGRQLHVAQVVRYFAGYAAARQAALAGEIGPLAELHLCRLGAAPRADWFHDEARSGGVLMDQLIHDLDYARWVLGEVDWVEARREPGFAAPGVPVLRATVRLIHRSGAVSRIDGGWLEPGAGFYTDLTMVGEIGEIRHHGGGAVDVVVGDKHTPALSARQEAADLPYDTQLAEFLSAIAGGPAPRVSAADGVAAVDLALAAIAAADSGRAVPPGDRPPGV